MNPAAILHVTSLFGGGVERYLRDIVAGIDRPQLIWHAGESADVIEDPARGRFWPLAPDAVATRGDRLAGWLKARGVGLVHLHQLTRAPRERARWACQQLGVRQVATLHDILFLRPDAFSAPDPLAPNPAWLAETAQMLLDSAAVTAPSRWLADLAEARIPGLAVAVIPNGSPAVSDTGVRHPCLTPVSDTATPAVGREFAERRPARVVALLGALGPHKGSDLVEELAERLAGSAIGVVVIGYLENRFHPGWHRPGLYVHGAFPEGAAPGLLRAYGADLVLMPNAVPESFSYALSDAWSAGVPVLAAPAGALAERLAAHGGGWLLPERFDAGVVADAVRALVGGARDAERQQVQSGLATRDFARIPPLDAMTRSLDAFYARFGIDPAAPATAGEAEIESLLAKNLDGSLFRAELVRLADELAQTLTALEDSRQRHEAFEAEARGWIAKLEGDVRAVQEALRVASDERDTLAREADLLRLNKEALDRLPSPLRRLLLKLAFNARR